MPQPPARTRRRTASSPARPERLTAARIVYVSGKGGTGKTTVAAAIALAAARGGRNVLLCEIEQRQAFASLFGIDRLLYEPTRLAPNLSGISVEADASLVEYLHKMYGIPKISRALAQSKLVEFATATAPGLRDILLIGKVREEEMRRSGGLPVYDLVVVDAPPTGRLPRFLDAPRAIAELVRAGPIRGQALSVQTLVLDPARTQVVLVTHPEEMPVRETAEAFETLTKMAIGVGPVVVNGVWPQLPPLGRDAAQTLRAEGTAAGVELSEAALGALAAVATTHARRARNQRRAAAQLLREVPRDGVELPFLFAPRLGLEEVGRLAGVLEGSGLL